MKLQKKNYVCCLWVCHAALNQQTRHRNYQHAYRCIPTTMSEIFLSLTICKQPTTTNMTGSPFKI